MSRKNSVHKPAVVLPQVEAVDFDTLDLCSIPEPKVDFDTLDLCTIPAAVEDHRKSVVKSKYRVAYKDRAKARGDKSKLAKRSTWDWLAQEMAARTIDKKGQLDVAALEELLDANGVKHRHWNRTTPGWQGRLRMSGRMSLQTIVAANGHLIEFGGTTIEAPADWVAKHTQK
jgi:hypothetical protein